jgi:predicted secreted hydrolase
MGFSLDTLLQDTREAARVAFDTVTETLYGKAETLRDGTEHAPVSLPRDLAAHPDAQTEWWYYTGHAKTDSGREFGIELVFFKRRTDLDNFSVVPLRLLGNPFYFAHFAITDITAGAFRYAHRKSANGPLDLPASASEAHYHLRLGDWSIREAHGHHVVRASINGDMTLEATLRPAKKVVLNGRDGVSFKDEGEASRYFSYTRMDLEGDLTENGVTEHFTGSAWMDREFGTWTPTENQKGWDWFSIQLDDQTELMCYQLRNSAGEPSPFSSGTLVHADGTSTSLAHTDFSIVPTDEWKSPKSGAVYPSGWKVKVPGMEIDLTVMPVIKDQELDTRGSTMIVYWEGACRVTGAVRDVSVSGRAYVELVGYDRSHENPNLASFLLGNSLDWIKVPEWLASR